MVRAQPLMPAPVVSSPFPGHSMNVSAYPKVAFVYGNPWELGELTGLTGLEISEGLFSVPQILLWKALLLSCLFFPREKPRVHQTLQPGRAAARFTKRPSSLGKLQTPRQIPLCLSARIKT